MKTATSGTSHSITAKILKQTIKHSYYNPKIETKKENIFWSKRHIFGLWKLISKISKRYLIFHKIIRAYVLFDIYLCMSKIPKCLYKFYVFHTHFKFWKPIKPTCLNKRSITVHVPKLSPISRANMDTCSPIWHNTNIVLNAINIIKYGVTDPLKFFFVATGTNGEMKNINRYTNDIPTGRYSAAAKKRDSRID